MTRTGELRITLLAIVVLPVLRISHGERRDVAKAVMARSTVTGVLLRQRKRGRRSQLLIGWRVRWPTLRTSPEARLAHWKAQIEDDHSRLRSDKVDCVA